MGDPGGGCAGKQSGGNRLLPRGCEGRRQASRATLFLNWDDRSMGRKQALPGHPSVLPTVSEGGRLTPGPRSRHYQGLLLANRCDQLIEGPGSGLSRFGGHGPQRPGSRTSVVLPPATGLLS